jgi:hypothetical protein
MHVEPYGQELRTVKDTIDDVLGRLHGIPLTPLLPTWSSSPHVHAELNSVLR